MQSFFSNKKAIAIFVLPSLLLFTIIVFYPLAQIFIKSFYDWNGLSKGTFIGLENYTRLFEDTTFKISIKNGLIFAAFLTIYQIGLGTVLAFAASNIKTKAGGFFRIVYFLPVVLSVTVVCQLWLSVFNSEYGLLNKIFEMIGMAFSQDWLSERDNAIYVVAFVNAWHYLGYQFALILAGIKSIPSHYYEAAQIDGASPFQAHLKITVPMLAETYRFCLVLAITGGLNAFTQMFIMTNGGPGTSTYTLTYMMYSSAFRATEYGYGMAAASFLVIECLIATIVINKLIAKENIVY
ncbi:MAG: sugar ABC transporter permease [Maledivibacter sp.]|jgi:raffinose/stachyose/melibiose transport system permease protein|nr:sugar ABC transporter permease [Maledivibacter sp.]